VTAQQAKPILVTGAAGFVGQVVARRLSAAGRPVIGTDLVAPAPDAGMGAGFVFAQADARDLARHTALLAGGCDGIIHCGGISGPMLARDNPAELLDINMRGSLLLLELARIFTLRRFVLCSSVSAYGMAGADGVATEETPLRASTAYGTSKAASDLLLQTFAAQYGLSAVALRLGWVYGPRRRTDGLLRPMIRSAFDGARFTLPQGADHALQFVHVEDVAEAIIAAFDAPGLARPAYNINGSEVLTLGAIAALVTQLVPAAEIAIGPGLLPETDVQPPMSLAAAEAELGWRPRITLAEGLRGYAAWLRGNAF
jgi:nucleoside-diphosphate-sugar epimerase